MWKQDFYAALLRFVRDELGHADAVKVTELEFLGPSVDPAVDLYYLDGSGNRKWVLWEGDFAGLIGRLTEEEK